MHEPAEVPHETLRRLVNGYRVSQALHALAVLGVPDLLRGGPRDSDGLAAESGADPDALYRLLRALAAHGVLLEEPGRRFALTPVGALLCSGAPGALGSWAAYLGRAHHWTTWGDLLHSVRSGKNSFEQRHGQDVWAYRAEHPDDGAAFQHFMAQTTRGLHAALLAAYDFGRFGHVVDVGGGQGALLTALLQAHPQLHAVLFDQPSVVLGAHAALEQAGMAGRCEVVGGSFFESVPAGGGAYLLKWVLHDWDDAQAALILRRCREAMSPTATLLVIERVLGDPGTDADAVLSDLSMLVVTGGRERTLTEFQALLTGAGFSSPRQVRTASPVNLLEASPT